MTPIDKMRTLFEENFFGPLAFTQFIARQMMRARSGSIVNLSSSAAIEGNEGRTGYASAKAAVITATKVLARELGPEVLVNGVAPGAIMWPDNEMDEHTKNMIIDRTALKRAGDPSHIAETILFLVKSDYITGQIIAVDGGRTLNI